MSKWIDKMEDILKKIESLDPEDRLSYWRALQICSSAIYESVIGWSQYLSNPVIQDKFSMEEIKGIFEVYRKIAVEFIKLDIEATSLFEKKISEEKKKKNKLVV